MPFFSTIHFNIRSLSANHDGLTMLLSDLQHSLDVITFEILKISETIPDSMDSLNKLVRGVESRLLAILIR